MDFPDNGDVRRYIQESTEALTRKAVDLALAGDMAALRLCLERLVPVRKDRPVSFSLPPLAGASDAPSAMAAVATAVGNGEVSPAEAADLAKLVDAYVRALEVSDLERRLRILEGG